VTFNAPQQMIVLDCIEEEAAATGRPIPKSLFVKNIENVQGDEKDIVVFSVGYAPDKRGKMVMQFGSLNAAGGENRLNVAVTRAREKIILITSINPEQLHVDEIKNDGPKLLRKYLEYAQEVNRRAYRPRVSRGTTHTPEWYLNSRIQQWSKERMQDFIFDKDALPFTDVCVLQSEKHVGVILTDDVRYFSSPSAKDVHAYTPSLLTRKNWKYHMVYSRNFWKDKEKMESDLIFFVGSSAG